MKRKIELKKKRKDRMKNKGAKKNRKSVMMRIKNDKKPKKGAMNTKKSAKNLKMMMMIRKNRKMMTKNPTLKSQERGFSPLILS